MQAEINQDTLMHELSRNEDFRVDALLQTLRDGAQSLVVNGEHFQTPDEDGTWLTCSFASEFPVTRWFGTLCLACHRFSIDKARVIDNAVPFLRDHKEVGQGNMLGMVRDIWVSAGVAYMKVQFNNRTESLRIREEMLNGLRPGVSPWAVPLSENDIEILEDNGLFEQHVRFNRWAPYEISSVAVAANPKVGAGSGKLTGGESLSWSGSDMDSNVGAMLHIAQRRYFAMSDNMNIGQQGEEQSVPPVVQEVPQQFQQIPPGQPPVMTPQGQMLQGYPQGYYPQQMPQMYQPQPMQQMQPVQPPQVYQPPAGSVVVSNEQLEALTSGIQAINDKAEEQAEHLEIFRLGSEKGVPELAAEHIASGGKVSAFREKLTSIVMNPTMRQSRTIPNNSGPQDYSLARLVRAKAFPDDREAQRAAEYELSAGNDIAQQAVQGGTMVPFHSYGSAGYKLGNGTPPPLLFAQRANGERLDVTTAGTSAGSVVQTLWDFDRTVDFLIEDADILQLCDVAMGLTGNVQIPIELWTGSTDKGTGAGTGSGTIGGSDRTQTVPEFIPEGGQPSELSPTFTHYNASPNMLQAKFEISRQSLVQTSGWIERRIRATAARIFRAQINYFLINGRGHATYNEPYGLVTARPSGGSPGTTTALPAIASPGAINDLNWATLVNIEQELADEWIPDMGRAWLVGRNAYRQMLTTERTANNRDFILKVDEENAGRNRLNRMFFGDIALRTSHLGDNRIIYGNFMDFFVGFWDGFEVVVEGITNPPQIKITIMVMWDAIVARPQSFISWTGTGTYTP